MNLPGRPFASGIVLLLESALWFVLIVCLWELDHSILLEPAKSSLLTVCLPGFVLLTWALDCGLRWLPVVFGRT